MSLPDVGDTGWLVSIDRELCMGSGLCVMYAPETFDQDDETKAILRPERGDVLESVKVAVEACPTRAITLHISASDN